MSRFQVYLDPENEAVQWTHEMVELGLTIALDQVS